MSKKAAPPVEAVGWSVVFFKGDDQFVFPSLPDAATANRFAEQLVAVGHADVVVEVRPSVANDYLVKQPDVDQESLDFLEAIS